MQQQPSQQQQQQQMGQAGGVPARVATPEVGRSNTPANIIQNMNQQRQLAQAQAQAQQSQMQMPQQQTQMSPNAPGQPRPIQQQQQFPPPSTPTTTQAPNAAPAIPATPIHPGSQTPLSATAPGLPQQQHQRLQPGQQVPIQPGQPLPPHHQANIQRDNAAGSQKMPIPQSLTVSQPVPVSMPPSRPTLTGGANMPTNQVMGTPGLIKQPQFRFDEDGGYGLLSKRKLEELVKQIDPDEKLDPDVEEVRINPTIPFGEVKVPGDGGKNAPIFRWISANWSISRSLSLSMSLSTLLLRLLARWPSSATLTPLTSRIFRSFWSATGTFVSRASPPMRSVRFASSTRLLSITIR